MATKAKAGTVEWIREKKAEQEKRQAELDAAIEENRKKMESASAKMSAALASGKREEYYEAEAEFKDADFAIKHYELKPEVPLEVSEEEVSQIAAAVVQDHNQIMEAQEGKYKEALEGLRDALRGMAKQQDAFLKLCEEFGRMEGWAKEKEKAKLIADKEKYDPAITFLYEKCGLINRMEAIELETVLIACEPTSYGCAHICSMIENPCPHLNSGRYADPRGMLRIY